MSLLQMSFSGAVLIIVIAAIRAVTINKLPKITFLILWGIVLFRLLIPYTVPSVFSVYTLVSPKISVNVNTINTGTYVVTPTNVILPSIEATIYEQTGESPQLPINHAPSVPIEFIIWLAGMTLCAVFFTISYLHWRFEFQTSLPVQNNFVSQWLKVHLRKRPVSVRQSDKILTPLTYGIFKPVILMPKKTNWENTEQLEYVLLHEYVHICRYDSAIKLISTFALCIHWFNPFVWVMYFLLQRDIELACDESVVRRFGETSKATYAHMLIDMEARKSSFMPLSNSFNKNAIEERIIAIMKIKKTSALAVLTAVILIIGITTAFATTAADKKTENKKVGNNHTNFTDEEVAQLLALQFDGYEDMSVSEYQNKVWEKTDTKEYLDLLERFSQDTALYEKKDSDETANFLFYTLDPLTAEKWQTREFGGACRSDYTNASDNASLEYWVTLTIQNADTLTVREYNNARIGMVNGLHDMLQDKTVEQLQTEPVMQKMIHAKIEALKGQWSSEKLKVDVDYVYRPLSEFTTQNSEAQSSATQDAQQEQETRRYPNGTKEDYRSLLALKTPDYQKMSVADFNVALLDWANEDYERMERINIDTSEHDFAVDLTSDELFFVTVSVMFSGMENGAYVRSIYTGKPGVDPSYGQYLPEKLKQQNGQKAWCDLYYQFSYHITDKNAITVGERDNCISGMMTEIQDFWNAAAFEDLMNMTKEDIVKVLDKIAAEYSNDKITITITKDETVQYSLPSFECINIVSEEYKTGVIDIGALNIEDEESEDVKMLQIGVINTDALKIRDGASEDAKVLYLLQETQAVVISSEKNGFYHVFIPSDEENLEGWVKKEYVDVNGWIEQEYIGMN